MSAAVSPLMELYRAGALDDVLARSEDSVVAEDKFVRALALAARGYGATALNKEGERLSQAETAADILKPLAAGKGDLALLAQAELLNARYVGLMTGVPDKALTVEATSDVARSAERARVRDIVQLRAHLVGGLVALRGRNFERARIEIESAQAIASESRDELQIAEANFALGRLAAWQGRADIAEQRLNDAIDFWQRQGNALQSAHAMYELGVMYADRREWNVAVDCLSGVLEAYRASGVSSGYLDRAQQALGAALIGAGQFEDAQGILEPLREAADDYRFAMVHRDLGRLRLRQAAIASADERSQLLASARQEWRVAYERIATWGATDFPVLSLRHLEAELVAAEAQAGGVSAQSVAGDMFARVAEAFSAKANERPHEINARLAALDAYLVAGASDVATKVERESIAAAARTEAERLNSAAASVGFRLNDEAVALIDAATRVDGSAAVAVSTEESLLTFMRRDVEPGERLTVLARLCEALGRIHDIGARPCGFGPSDVVVRLPGNPAIRDFSDPDTFLRPERVGDRPFVSPELLKGREGDARSDLYVVGALMIAWFGEKLPANEGGLFMWLRRALRGRPLKKQGKAVSGLALELTSLNAKHRPPTAYETADRFRQAAETLNGGS